MSSNFRVGQKVSYIGGLEDERCIEFFFLLGGVKPEEGKVYTVRKTWSHPETPDLGIFLDEISNPLMDTNLGRCELPYPQKCFRPVVTRPTSIAMLTGKRVGVSA